MRKLLLQIKIVNNIYWKLMIFLKKAPTWNTRFPVWLTRLTCWYESDEKLFPNHLACLLEVWLPGPYSNPEPFIGDTSWAQWRFQSNRISFGRTIAKTNLLQVIWTKYYTAQFNDSVTVYFPIFNIWYNHWLIYRRNLHYFASVLFFLSK